LVIETPLVALSVRSPAVARRVAASTLTVRPLITRVEPGVPPGALNAAPGSGLVIATAPVVVKVRLGRLASARPVPRSPTNGVLSASVAGPKFIEADPSATMPWLAVSVLEPPKP
jgi:hypothetical protein